MSSESSPSITVTELAQSVVRLRRLVVLLSALVVGLLILCLSRLVNRDLTVERITIVDANGARRLVISNAERFPLPYIDGKEYKRAVAPAGMVFFDSKGNEIGGLALTDVPMGRVTALSFDYPNYDAMGFITRVSADGKSATSGIQINSHAPANLSLPEAAKVVNERVLLQNRDENAEVLLKDPQGRDRLRLRVDDKGEASVEFLDEKGATTLRLPQGLSTPAGRSP